jgi:hypothetical protein
MMSPDSEQIVRSMERIRRSQASKLADLGEESQRLTDWREYARSAPIASLVGSLVIGALVGSRLAGQPSQSVQDSTPSQLNTSQLNTTPKTAATKGLVGRLLGATLSIAIPMIKSAAKQQMASAVTSAIQSISESRRTHHDTPA